MAQLSDFSFTTRTDEDQLTISARLYAGLDIPNALHGQPVLVVPIDVLVFELADLVQQHTQPIGNIRHVLIAVLAPDRQLLRHFHALFSHHFHAAHHVFFHLDELGELLGQVGAECAGRVLAEGMAHAAETK